MYDCMNEQINGGRQNSNVDQLKQIQYNQFYNIVEEQLINRVTRFLDETSFYHSSET